MKFSLGTLGIGLALGTGLGLGIGRIRWTAPTSSIPLSDKPTEPKPEVNVVLPKLDTGRVWAAFQGNAHDLLTRAQILKGNEASYFMVRVLEEMPSERLPELAKNLVAEPHAMTYKSTALQLLVSRWIKCDEVAAVAWVKSLPKEQQTELLFDAVDALAETDPIKAWRLALSADPSRYREGIMLRALAVMSEHDPTAALALASGQSAEFKRNYLKQLSATLSQSDPAGAYALMRANSLGNLNGMDFTLWQNWGKQDPAAALAAISKFDATERINPQRYIYQAWAGVDTKAALRSAQAIPEKKDREYAMTTVVSEWAAKDPVAVLGWLKQQPSEMRDRLGMSGLLGSLIVKQPQLALEGLSWITNRDERRNALSHISNNWVQQDPEAAWHWFSTLPDSDQQQAVGSMGSAANKFAPERMLSELSQISNPRTRQTLCRYYLSNTEMDAGQRMTVLNQLPQDEAQDLLRENSGLVNAIAKDGGSQAMQLLTKYDIPKTNSAWQQIARKLASEDPEAAYAWASALRPDEQEHLMGSVLSGMTAKNPSLALERASKISSERERDHATQSILSLWGEQDAAALEQATAAMSGQQREHSLEVLADLKLSTHGSTGAEFFLSLQQSGREEDLNAMRQKIDRLAQLWGEDNVQAAAAWANKITDPEAQTKYIAALSSLWSGVDSMAASAWIRDLPAGRSKDGAVRNLISRIVETDPASAVVWAGQIQDTDEQQSNYFNALRALLQKDPTAGKQAVSQAPLPDTLKQKLLKEP